MDRITLALLLLIAFAPSIILAVRLRNAELHRREPWRALARAFLWGAVGAATLSILAESVLQDRFAGAAVILPALPLTVVLIAPLIEEVAKATGLFLIRDPAPEPEDGYIYGGAVGLGFAATENAIYVLSAFLVHGEDSAMATALYRGIATVALHGAASAIAGYGIWQARYGGHRMAAVWALLAAIALHMAYNGLSRLQPGWATLLAAGIALVAYLRIMRRVRILDERGATPP